MSPNELGKFTATTSVPSNNTNVSVTFAPRFIKLVKNNPIANTPVQQNEKLSIETDLKQPTIQFQPKKSKSNSLYTSHEIPKPKAQAADSIKSLNEVNQFLQYFLQHNQYRNYALFVTGISSAYRISDLLKLRYSDFYNEDNTFKSDFDMCEQKTSNRRKMEITTPIKKAISLYVQESRINFEYDSFMFRSEKCKDKAIKEETVHKILKTIGELELRLPYNIGSHSMRKTYGYWYLQTHKNDMTALSTLQEIFGHSSEKITLRYCGISKEEMRQNNRDVSNLWEGLMSNMNVD